MRSFYILFFMIICVTQISGQVRNDTIIEEKPDTTAPIVRIWQLKDNYSRQENYHLDTMQTSFQIYHPVMKYFFTSSYLGNLGLPARSNNYFHTRSDIKYLFLNPNKAYIVIPADNVYYNIRKPFSLLEYSTTMQNRLKREQMVRILHTQNISKFMNAGLDIKLSSSEGRYINQKTKVLTFRFFGSYIKGDYSLHTSFASNTFKLGENGGIQNDSLFLATNLEERIYYVNLTGANALTRNLGFQITQRYHFGKVTEYQDTLSAKGIRRLRDRTSKTGSLIHTFEYERNKRIYKDETSGLSPSFYRNFYINPKQSNDSTFQQSIINTLQIMLDENPNRKNDFGARAFISHELVEYLFNRPVDTTITGNNDTLVRDVTDRQYNNIYAGASLVHTVGTGWNWNFTGKIWFSGYRAGDMVFMGEINKFIRLRGGKMSVMAGGSLTTTEPDYFLHHYASNHFKWENNFNKTKEIIGFLSLENEPGRFNLKGSISTISDFMYFDTDTLPSQHHPVINVFSTDLYKRFKLGPFNSIHHILYQFSTNKSIIRIPEISYYTSNFFAFTLVKNVLTVETGFDLVYYTKYKGLAYMPSYGMFYNQDERRLGNYPYFDLFITAKIKRTRLYFKLDHVNSGFTGKEYFQVLHYPMPPRSLKFGLSWTFYN